jgi:enamine deaminase RidA (YjgF/YER057c/UK114 family)
VVKVTILVTDMGNFGEVVEARRQHFSPPCPADSLVEVRPLYTRGALVEIKAVALRSAAREG